MRTLARTAYLDSEPGVLQELPRAGSALENPLVFDDAAREIKLLADQGLVEIIAEHQQDTRGGTLIDRLLFKRVR